MIMMGKSIRQIWVYCRQNKRKVQAAHHPEIKLNSAVICAVYVSIKKLFRSYGIYQYAKIRYLVYVYYEGNTVRQAIGVYLPYVINTDPVRHLRERATRFGQGPHKERQKTNNLQRALPKTKKCYSDERFR